MAARKFRKVYLVTEGSNVFGSYNYEIINLYRLKSTADRMCGIANENALDEAKKTYNTNKPVPQYKVHAFYLVHEDHFEK